MIYLAKLSDKEQIKMKRYGQVIKVDEKKRSFISTIIKKFQMKLKILFISAICAITAFS